ncbi:MAG: anti-sigma factor, partial [Bacteroidota bacterium]
MNIKEYLESGIIENYVLGATTPEENREVEAKAQEHPEVQTEIEANRVALLEYIMEFKQEPPAEIKDKVMAKLASLEEEDEAEEASIQREIRHIQSNGSRGNSLTWLPYLAAACFALLVISAGLNVILYNNWQSTQNQLELAQNENSIMAQDLKVLQAGYESNQDELAILKNPHNVYVELNTTLEEAPDAQVVLIWDAQTKDVFLQVRNLPEPPPGKQYQLWSIDGEEVVDAGVFDMGN